jgi:hypothetical protein
LLLNETREMDLLEMMVVGGIMVITLNAYILLYVIDD